MIGGSLVHSKHSILETVDEIEELISNNGYSIETLDVFKETSHTLKRVAEMLKRIDYLIHGDYGEEEFLNAEHTDTSR